MNKKQISITLGVMCLILVFCVMVQINTMEDVTNTVGKRGRDNGLRDQVLMWKERYDRTYEQLENAEKELEVQREVSTGEDENSVEKQERLKELNTYLGLTDVKGKGIIITVQDNTASKFVTSRDLVHDGDIRYIVNEIKNIGADAISVNGQRIVPSTVISCAGAVVQINGESKGAPFVIEAIGNDALFYNIQRPGSFISRMKEDGIQVDVKQSDNLTIERFNGVLTDKYIKSVE